MSSAVDVVVRQIDWSVIRSILDVGIESSRLAGVILTQPAQLKVVEHDVLAISNIDKIV
jgi:hypothetical protein